MYLEKGKDKVNTTNVEHKFLKVKNMAKIHFEKILKEI